MFPLTEFTDFIYRNTLFTKESKILLTVSGGKDSVLMVHLFKLAGFDFGIAHCNFNLRGTESRRDEEFVKALADSVRAPFHVTLFETGAHAKLNKVSTQMAARQLRYTWFDEISIKYGYDVIATAHHQTDAVETVLLNLVRGTGISGLHGIFPKREKLVRPLLFLSRDRIDDLIRENNLEYVEDSSNLKADYARNKIRLKVLPQLRAINPVLEQTFQQNIRRFAETELVLKQVIHQLKREICTKKEDGIYLDTDKIKELNPQHLLLFEVLKDYEFSEAVVSDIIRDLDSISGTSFYSSTHRLILDRKQLILTPLNEEEKQDELSVSPDDRSVAFSKHQFLISYRDAPGYDPIISKAHLDAEKLIFPLVVRAWRKGDRFIPLGMKGFKKVSDFFIDQKVPLTSKSQIPILVNGNGDIMWIGGWRQDNRYKVTASTKKVAIFELKNI